MGETVPWVNNDILKILYAAQDTVYRDFQSSLIPTVDKESFIGVRTPRLRAIAKEMVNTGQTDCFIMSLPHRFFEENQLHSFIISEISDFNVAVTAVDRFLWYIDNWATCDQMSPKVFEKNAEKLLPYIKKWIKSKRPYTVRFAVLSLMRYFLDGRFDIKYIDMVAKIKSKEYYVNMMRAWYFATAVAKQYESVLPWFQNYKIDTWTHNRAIQKAIESFRVPQEHKNKLKVLKIN